MSHNSGAFLVPSHGHSSLNPGFPATSSPLKRTVSGTILPGNSSNTSRGFNMNVSSTPSIMRPSNSMGPMKPATMDMTSTDKSNSLPYPSRYMRKGWPMSQDKNLRGHGDHEPPYLRSALPTHSASRDSINSSSFTIEPSIDDGEIDDICFSTRHIAAARFQRNQRLLHELFNEICIPDLRVNVNVDRILTLRRQVAALKTHRETFEKDIDNLEEKHAEKKRKLLQANEKYHHDYLEASSTNLSQEKINEIVQKYETMEKLQKEKQVLLQQQSVPRTVSQSTTHLSTKAEPITTVDVPQQSISTPPPSSQPVKTPLSTTQPIPTQMQSTQSVQSQIPVSQSTQPQLPPPPQSQSTPSSQGYPMMHSDGSHTSASGYSHPQQTHYRPTMNQRPAQYPSNVHWQQQPSPQHQQWQTNTYDPRYYNSYSSTSQWPQQQWSYNQSQQQTPSMRGGGPSHQQSQMYANGVQYGYGNSTAQWNTTAYPSPQYSYSPNSSYDPSIASAPSQQQYYPSSQMHNPSQGYDYAQQLP